MLLEADKEIDAWYNKWRDHIHQGMLTLEGVNLPRTDFVLFADERGAVLDYLGRYTRFCILSYAVRFLRHSTQEQGLSLLQRDQVRSCVLCANRVLDWPLRLGPVQKDRLRYVTDTRCIMISFCCLFIIASCQTFASSIPNTFECLENVKASARLMISLSTDDESRGYVHGMLILERVKAVQEALERQKDHEGDLHRVHLEDSASTHIPSAGSTTPNVMHENLNSNFIDNGGIFDIEPLWDFSILLPNTW